MKLQATLVTSIVLAILSIVFLWACHNQLAQQAAQITVDLKSNHSFLEGKMIYLGNADTRDFIDSARVKNGKVKLALPDQSTKDPVWVALIYKSNESNQSPFSLLGYTNPFKKNVTESYFYAESGTTQLELDTSPTAIKYVAKLRRRWNKRSILLRFTQMRPQTKVAFLHLSFRPSEQNRPNQEDKNAQLIQKYPFSFSLLGELYRSRGTLSDTELTHLLTLFDGSLQETETYKSLVAYAKYQNQTGNSFPRSVSFLTPNNQLTSSVLSPTKYTLVVFWASWCGPCRREIPQLKSLYSKQNQQLSIVSLSLDEQQPRWHRALQEEKMFWPQLLVHQPNSLMQLDKKYDLKSIPVWLLFSPDHKLIARNVGQGDGVNSVDYQITQLLEKEQ
ncbi:TlpA family protein disulfide reductase [Spirosoma pomorum]